MLSTVPQDALVVVADGSRAIFSERGAPRKAILCARLSGYRRKTCSMNYPANEIAELLGRST